MTNAITRWSPETDLYRNRLDRMFNQMLHDLWGARTGGEELGGRAWMPAVDVQETQDALLFAFELPGLRKEEVEITIESNVLTVSGERKFEKDSKTAGEFHRLERSYGAFSRSFTLPTGVQTEQVAATFADGVLTVRLPKQENARPRKIEIR
jgi:HSP20 family protein